MTMEKKRPDQLGMQRRFVSLRLDLQENPEGKLDPDTRTMRLSFSSEYPVERWYGTEILSHAPGAMRQGARQASMPLLYNHDMNDLLGVVESIELGRDQRAYAVVRFGKDERGDWAMQQVADGVLTNVSFAYQVFKFVEDLEADTYTGIDWEPYEISLVTVPADPTVGTDRSEGSTNLAVVIETLASNQPAQADNQESIMRMKHAPQDLANDGTTGSTGGASVVDIKNARAAGAEETRNLLREIDAMCTKHKLSNDVRSKLVAEANDVLEARGMVLLELQSRTDAPKALTSLSDDLGLSAQERKDYSLVRAINAQMAGNWKKAGFERAVSDELAKRNGDREVSGFLFPNDLPWCPTEAHARAYRMMGRAGSMGQRATYQVGATPGTGVTGGTLVATQLLADSFIEVLRNQSVTAQLGAMMLPGLVGAVDIPRRTLATAAFWVGESGAITESEAAFDKVSLRPRTVAALSKVSRQMLLQSTPAIEMLIRSDLVAVGALAIDLAALSGSGTGGQPTGIANQSGVAQVVGGTNGANLSFDHIIQLQYATKFANAPQANTGYALNSKAVGYLSTQKATTGQYLWDPQGGLTNGSPDKLKGRYYAESQQLRANLTKGTSVGTASELIYGNWMELMIAEWGITEIAVNPYDSTGFANGDVVLRMMQTVDVAVRHGASFSYMGDALTPGF